MLTTSGTIALLGAVASIAIAAACVATLRARAARAALRAGAQEHGAGADHAGPVEVDRRLARDVTDDLSDALGAITRQAELLIASLDPSGPGVQHAEEIQRVALRAARLAGAGGPLRGGDRPPPTADVTAAEAGPDPVRAEARPAMPVLVVEDEPGMRELIKTVLMRSGHEVVTVAGPHAALAVLNRQPAIALMLVDVVMPEMDGYDLMAEARKISPSVRAVFISAFAPDPARHPRGDGFLAKPFTSESLTDIVEKASQ
ncbi:MAG: response regulator [Acidobacteriota bacterium]|nr:response regulator [Acidobacteriota bacterium]